MGTTATWSGIRYWNIVRPKTIGYCTTAKFNEYESLDCGGKISPGSSFTQGKEEAGEFEIATVKDINHPLLKHLIKIIKLPLKVSITILEKQPGKR